MKYIFTIEAGDSKLAFDCNNDYYDVVTECSGNLNTVYLTAKKEFVLYDASAELDFDFSESDLIMANGYQSWTETKEFAKGENVRDLDKLPKFLLDGYAFKSYGSQHFHKVRKNVVTAFDYGYVKGNRELFIGNLNYVNAYLIIDFCRKENVIRIVSDVYGKKLTEGERFCVFNYLVFQNVSDGENEYFSRFTPRCNRKLFGYTSWYNHYQNINSDIILTALKDSDDRFDLFQIDDGFEPFVGDWLNVDKNKFPEGLSPIVEKIHSSGKMAGIWLAPFAVEQKSDLFRNHPDWIVKDKNGDPVKCGANWSGFYSLDLSNSDAAGYVKQVLSYYKEIGFDFFKLDFLYCCSVIPFDGKTRAETADFAYSLIKNELSDKLILGCGAVLSSAFEKFDYMRIGPDVSLIFDDVWYMKFMHPERISTKVTLQNTVYRSAMNGRVFMNDPDVFLLRDDNISLSKEQRYALTKINSLFGSLLMTSDNPKSYGADKSEVLNEALEIFRSAKVGKYERRGEMIVIDYVLNGRDFTFEYDTQKGVITNG